MKLRKGRPSSTARLIAMATVMLERDPRFAPLIPPEAAEIARGCLHYSGTTARLMNSILATSAVRAAAGAAEQLMLPGITAHYALRKRYIELAAERALAEGYDTIIILGAGCDALAYRMALRGISAIEIDHPSTQRLKRIALAALPTHERHLSLRPWDLSKPLPADLLATSAGAGRAEHHRSLLIIAEGLLMYLEPEQIESLLDSLAIAPAARLRFIFTFMRPGPDGRPHFNRASRLVEHWLRWRGESFRWSQPPESMEHFLAERGFALRDIAGPGELRRLLPPAAPADLELPEDELLCIAERERAADAPGAHRPSRSSVASPLPRSTQRRGTTGTPAQTCS